MKNYFRGEEGNIKISKTILQERNLKGYVCVFFPIDIEDLNNLIQSALNSRIDPKKIIYSVYKSCEELNLDVHEEVKKMFKDVSEHKLKIVEGR
jgi:hypothetical protein